ncbi:hypothetical protein BB559_002920 [Furculomyces boomerangus]|uniref:RRM domain-containing protein n=1 Tax=Furculomyces boomerangus TaxID=61424 RepID=A0A2T9YR34_9FUNG|nr:hypothetical protein BB559_002920 [Furculomyces boomerangus]
MSSKFASIRPFPSQFKNIVHFNKTPQLKHNDHFSRSFAIKTTIDPKKISKDWSKLKAEQKTNNVPLPSNISRFVKVMHLPHTATKQDIRNLHENTLAITNITFEYNKNLLFSGNCCLEFATLEEASNFYQNAKNRRGGKKNLLLKFAQSVTLNSDNQQYATDFAQPPPEIGQYPEKTVAVYGFPKSSRVEIISDRFPDFEFVDTAVPGVSEYKYYEKMHIKKGMKKIFVFHFATVSEAHRFCRTVNQTLFMPEYHNEQNLLTAWVLA